MDAIKVTRQNLSYVLEYVVKDANKAADFVNTFESNLANGEWTYVYTIERKTGFGTKTFVYAMNEKKFNETFEFVSIESPYSVTPITKK